MSTLPPYDAAMLPAGIRARIIPGINGLSMHVLEAGEPGRRCLLLLHGFPELAWSWRKVMPALAAAGYHVVAPDQRGYGRTTGWSADYDGDLAPFRMLNLVRDQLGLVASLGLGHVEAVIGHDFGSPVAAWCALVRPDVFRRVALMSAPFAGPLDLPEEAPSCAPAPDVHAALAALPRPRKHYQWYYSEPEANENMWRCPQGVHAFLRAYYHMKSADWPGNRPFPLAGWTAEALSQMPTYYIMDLDKGMAETVAPEMPGAAAIAACCRTASSPSMPASMSAPASRAACSGTAAAPPAGSRRRRRSLPDAPSMFPRSSSPVPATGESSRCRARCGGCGNWPARG
jgi:pimeloyl-ACP methyl ester carboxylesterase